METLSNKQNFLKQVMLLPNEVVVTDDFDVRPFKPDVDNDAAAVEALAKSIEEVGQLDAAVVFEQPIGIGGTEYVLYAGHRRLRAIQLVNERRSASAKPLIRLRAVVDENKGDYWRRAVLSNLQRNSGSPMNTALLMKQAKEKNGWKGTKGDQKCAEYFGVSPAFVGRMAKLLEVPVELQEGVHKGDIKASTALELNTVVRPEAMAEVLQQARLEQEVIDAEDAKATEPEVIESADESAADRPVPPPKPVKKAAPKKAISAPAVKRAVDKLTPEQKTGASLARTRQEIVAFFREFDSQEYGFINGAVRDFVRYFCGTWAPGIGNASVLKTKFRRLTEGAEPGTASKDESKAAALTTGTGRQLRSDRGRERKKRVDKPAQGVRPTTAKKAVEKKAPAKKAPKSTKK